MENLLPLPGNGEAQGNEVAWLQVTQPVCGTASSKKWVSRLQSLPIMPCCLSVPLCLKSQCSFPTSERFSSAAEVKILGARINHTPHTRILTDALYLSFYLLLNWCCYFQLSTQNTGLLLKNLGQLSKMPTELKRRIPGEREFRDGEHSLILISLEITVGGDTLEIEWPSKKGALYGGEEGNSFEELTARKTEILTWSGRLFS